MQVGIKNYPDYKYDDVAGVVISFKRSRPRRLKWRGPNKVVTLFSRAGYSSQKRTFTASEIMTMLESPTTNVAVKEPVTAEYIIGSRNGANFVFSPTPYVHPNEDAARTEAERLAKKHPGKRFVVLKVIGSVIASELSWS